MRVMMFDDDDFALREAGAQRELRSAFGSGRKRPGNRDTSISSGLHARDFEGKVECFSGKVPGRSWRETFACSTRRRDLPVLDDADGWIAEQAAQPDQNVRHG